MGCMWKIHELKQATQILKKYPLSVRKKYKVWIEIVKNGGSQNLKHFSGFKDELLKGKLKGCRSSRLNIKYRVVYIEKRQKREIYVLKIIPHNYKQIRGIL